jgi:hypothetical protein
MPTNGVVTDAHFVEGYWRMNVGYEWYAQSTCDTILALRPQPTINIIEGIRGRALFPCFCPMSYPMRPSLTLLEERLTVPPAPRAAEPRAPPERYRGLATRAGTLTEA